MLPIVISLVLYLLYFCQPDSHYGRRQLVVAVICALVTSVLIAVWIVVYIKCIYQYDEVYIGTGRVAGEGEEDPGPNYDKQDKSEYII